MTHAKYDYRISKLIKQCREFGLTIHSISVEREAGTSHWVDGHNVSGPEGCMDCGDEFEPDQYFRGDDYRRVGATWDALELDLRDPEAPDDANVERRPLCSYCSRVWRGEIEGLGLVAAE